MNIKITLEYYLQFTGKSKKVLFPNLKSMERFSFNSSLAVSGFISLLKTLIVIFLAVFRAW